MFDAGVGDGTVLARVMRSMHGRFPHMPFYIAGKELSLEDVKLTLDKVPDRLFEHPATVMVLTNMYYAEAPWLAPRSPRLPPAWSGARWPCGDILRRIRGPDRGPRAVSGGELAGQRQPRTGMPIYERPVVLVFYREDHQFLLDSVIPRAGRAEANFDLVIASQPYRAKSSVNFRARRIIAPLARAVAAGRASDRNTFSRTGPRTGDCPGGLARRKSFRREPS